MSETATITLPVLGQDCPEQGGVYVGSRIIDGRVHHVFTPDGIEHDVKNVEFKNIDSTVADFGEINSHSDWRAPDQENLMLAYINAKEHFVRKGMDSIYWSSTPYGLRYAWAVDFERGGVEHWNRLLEFRVRPFRSIIASSL